MLASLFKHKHKFNQIIHLINCGDSSNEILFRGEYIKVAKIFPVYRCQCNAYKIKLSDESYILLSDEFKNLDSYPSVEDIKKYIPQFFCENNRNKKLI